MNITSDDAARHHSSLSDDAQRHLWMHFTRLGAFTGSTVPVIARGEGCYVYDQQGKRYLDGLSGLFVDQRPFRHSRRGSLDGLGRIGQFGAGVLCGCRDD